MKKLTILVIALAFVTAGFISCEDCKECKSQTYDNGALIDESEYTEYCDAELDDINEGDTVTVGSSSEVWDCQ